MEPVLGGEPGERPGAAAKGGQVTEQPKPANESRIVLGIGKEGENT